MTTLRRLYLRIFPYSARDAGVPGLARRIHEGSSTVPDLPRYRANGWTVCEGNHLVATCHTGDDGELAASVAARIAAALNGQPMPEPKISAPLPKIDRANRRDHCA